MSSPEDQGSRPDLEGPRDALARAHQQREEQVHEARGALAEAVAALNVELGDRRREATALREKNAALLAERDRAVGDNRALRDYVVRLEAELRHAREPVGLLERIARRLRRRRG
jgi:DNA repair exonuclease SbcCD ATPase subunit